jgi:hypothetical protein
VKQHETVADPRLARDVLNGDRVEPLGAGHGVRRLDDLAATDCFGSAISGHSILLLLSR